jgi:DNA helicase HerA-like ATPase
MPETSTMGVSDFGSKGLVSKISQIALQGRKYGVGLLVIAQRTATVSKNVLTQCNTVIALNSFDETSVNFLSNVFGRPHAETLRDLPRLHAIVFGKGVRSQRPVIVEVPFDEEKAKASNKHATSVAVGTVPASPNNEAAAESNDSI